MSEISFIFATSEWSLCGTILVCARESAVYNEGVLFSVLIFLFVIESERGMCSHHTVLCYVWNVGALTTIATTIDLNGVKRFFFHSRMLCGIFLSMTSDTDCAPQHPHHPPKRSPVRPVIMQLHSAIVAPLQQALQTNHISCNFSECLSFFLDMITFSRLRMSAELCKILPSEGYKIKPVCSGSELNDKLSSKLVY